MTFGFGLGADRWRYRRGGVRRGAPTEWSSLTAPGAPFAIVVSRRERGKVCPGGSVDGREALWNDTGDGEAAGRSCMTERPDVIPLVVDLDGTLVATDTLWESAVLAVRNVPLACPGLALSLFSGKAGFKAALAGRVLPDASTLPYRATVLEYIRAARSRGRSVYLVTAADQRIADRVAEHLEVFDEAIGTTDGRNLRSARKAELLVERFGDKGFEYVGDSAADLGVWPKAGKGALVAAKPSVEAAAKAILPDVEVLVPRASGRLKAIFKALRPHQWSKNALLFLPALLAHQYGDPDVMLRVLIAFVCFSLCASSVYVVNDLLDLEQDRVHRTKKKRPFASGALSIPTGLALGAGTFGIGVIAALLFLPLSFVLVLLGYVAITTAYSVFLKRKIIVDVVTLASLFTYRVIAGGVAGGIELSFWLLAFSMFFFTGLAFAKRYSELRVLRNANRETTPGRGYQVQDLEIIASTGPACGLLAVLVFALYIHSDAVTSIYPEPRVLWLICPVLLYWVTRIWFLAAREQLDDDPVVFALKDRMSYVAGIIAAASVAAAKFWPI